MAVETNKKVHVFVVSDATGMTAERVIGAALVQFRNIEPVFKKYAYVRSKEEITGILISAEKLEAIVIYSLASLELREWLRLEKRKRNVNTLDLLGPPLGLMSKLWKIAPDFRPGIFKSISSDTLRLAEAIDFTLKHDDGQNLETIDTADLVILGISRTSKTPTSLYLSCNYNLKVANYPIIKGEQPPEQLFSLRCATVGFKIEPQRAAFLRQKRFRYMDGSDYTDLPCIREEIRQCNRIFSRIRKMKVIDVTYRSIEEIAGEIIESMTFDGFVKSSRSRLANPEE